MKSPVEWISHQWTERAPTILAVLGFIALVSVMTTAVLGYITVRVLGEHSTTLNTQSQLQAQVDGVINGLPPADRDILLEVVALNYNVNVVCSAFNLPCEKLPAITVPTAPTGKTHHH